MDLSLIGDPKILQGQYLPSVNERYEAIEGVGDVFDGVGIACVD